MLILSKGHFLREALKNAINELAAMLNQNKNNKQMAR